MDSTGWSRVRGILEEALALPDGERASFLSRACGGDERLRAEVESLLAQDSRTSGLEPPARSDIAAVLEGASSQPLRRVGPYVLEREIGSGGMGRVFLARRADADFEQRVAVKLVRRGMDTAEVLQRFRNERAVLAALEHENIARLYDGGASDDGLPYIVMEFVDGEPIDRYCDERRLSVRERLELFLPVCAAVHCAHQSLIVHRDLKPSNVLVARGVPKLLDFGIAKVLAPEHDEHTRTELRMLTPEYASPEQLQGVPITTASDVYSLGVILYELLCGKKPHVLERDAPGMLERAVIEREPEPPSAVAARNAAASSARASEPTKLRRELSGDLDTIVLCALRKEPARRYASADQLAGDIRRHLDGLPVLARPDTFTYRATKFVRRNKLAVGAAVALLAVLIAGLCTSTVLYLRTLDARADEHEQRTIAEHRFEDVRQLATSLIFDVHDSVAKLPSSVAARELIVTTAIDYLDRLLKDEASDLELRRDVVRGYLRVAALQFGWARGSLGRAPDALTTLERAARLVESLHAEDPGNELDQRLDYQIRKASAPCLENLLRTREALAACEQAAAICERLFERHPDDAELAADLIDIQVNRSRVLSALAEHERASSVARESVRIAEEFGDAHPEAPGFAIHRAGAWLSLAASRRTAGDLAGAEEGHRRALAILEPILAAAPLDEQALAEVANGLLALGRTLMLARRLPDAEATLERARELLARASAAEPRNGNLLQTLNTVQVDLSALLGVRGASDEAVAMARASLDTIERLVELDPDDPERLRSRATTQSNLGFMLLRAGERDEGVELASRAIDELRRLTPGKDGSAELRQGLFDAEYGLGSFLVGSVRNANLPPSERLEHLRLARERLASAREIYEALRVEGKLDTAHVTLAEPLASWSNGCDELVRQAEAELAAGESP